MSLLESILRWRKEICRLMMLIGRLAEFVLENEVFLMTLRCCLVGCVAAL